MAFEKNSESETGKLLVSKILALTFPEATMATGKTLVNITRAELPATLSKAGASTGITWALLEVGERSPEKARR